MSFSKNGRLHEYPEYCYGKMAVELTDRIQTEDQLNQIKYWDVEGPGGGRHTYEISRMGEDGLGEQITILHFQEGPRNDPESLPGILEPELLEIVRHRLKCFQAGPYACPENAAALGKIEEALEWMKQRVENRKKRNVFGTKEI